MTDMANIRQSINKVSIKGELVDKEVTYLSYKNNTAVEVQPHEAFDALRVRLSVAVDDTNIIPVHMYCNKLKKDGTENGFFSGLDTVAKTYTVREVDEQGNITQQGQIVTVYSSGNFIIGELRMNEYYAHGKLVSNPQVQAKSARTAKPDDPRPHHATFEMDGVILFMDREVDTEGNETGALILKFGNIGYGGKLSIFDLRVDKPEYVSQMESIYSVGDTVLFIGDIINRAVTKVKKTEMALGGVHEEIITHREQGLVITQGGFPYEGASAYTPEMITVAKNERENYLAELLQKHEQKQASQSSGMSGVAFGNSNASTQNSLDIPF